MDGGEAATMKAKGQIRPDAPAWEVSSNFNTVGRNRKSVTMDLTRPEGMEAFYRLVEQSDIFIENNAPDVVHHLSIDYETLKQHNPRLIMLSLSAFGATGPYRNYRAYGSNMEALVGHALLRGYADTDPTHNTSAFFADACAGATAAFAAMAAVKHRMNTGRGQYIDMSQSENVAHTLSQAVMDYSMNRRLRKAIGNRDAVFAPQGVYRCKGDDAWLGLSCRSDEEFEALCQLMGKTELSSDERFSSCLARHEHHGELDRQISAWASIQDPYDAFHALQGVGIPCGPVLNIAQVYADPHLHARGMWQKVTHPVAGTHMYYKSPISHMSKTPLEYWRHAPTLGQDNEYIYRQVLGYSEEEYEDLLEKGLIGTSFVEGQA
jgi:crotonobetainyl-CoA:carnitine CoA-transferase CaiB-like acyl-CoA transferase